MSTTACQQVNKYNQNVNLSCISSLSFRELKNLWYFPVKREIMDSDGVRFAIKVDTGLEISPANLGM